MKRKIISILACLIMLTLNANAQVELQTEEIESSISNETGEILGELGVNSVEDAQDISFSNIIGGIFGTVKNGLSAPVKLFALLVGISILSGLYNLLLSSKDEKFAALAGMLCAGTIVTSGIAKKINQISLMLSEGATFIGAFVPVMTAVTAAGGYPVTASAYNLLLIFASNIALYSSSGVVTSLLGCYLAVCLIAAFNSSISLNGLANGLKKTAIWGLGIISTLFVGILSIEGIAGKAADSVAMKTAKFALSSTIPIVGSALSDAIASVEGSVAILRTTVGTFGIIAGLGIALPTIVNVILTKLAIEGAAIAAEMLGTKRISELYKNLGSVMTVLIALTAFYFLVLLVSTTVVMVICS